MASAVGTLIGKYRVVGYLGSGATAEVYEAVAPESNDRVAIKVMRPVSSADQTKHFADRFTVEVDVLRELVDCPYVVRLHESGRLNDRIPYYVMDYLDGRTLEEEMADHGPYSVSEAFTIVRQLCMGLQTLHSRRIVHRDLKPANIIVRDNASPNVVLLDFGIARHVDTQGGLTVGAVGSPVFAAPEQVRNDPRQIGPATDLYALGVIIYIMLSGQQPFDISAEDDALSVMTMRLRREPVPLRERAAWVPPPLATVIDSCLAVQPRARPSSTAVVVQHFAQALDIEPLEGLACTDCTHRDSCTALPCSEALMPFADTVLEFGPPPGEIAQDGGCPAETT